jgi:hypothetical protein
MEQLVDENARKLPDAAVEGDAPLAKEGPGVHSAVAVAEIGDADEADGRRKARKTARDGFCAALQTVVGGGEERRHAFKLSVPHRPSVDNER